MKFYCDKCKCELKISQEVIDAWEKDYDDGDYGRENEVYEKWDGEHVLCDICTNESLEVWMDRIPDYETLAQREKRTGKAVDDNMAVWGLWENDGKSNWRLFTLEKVKNIHFLFIKKENVVIADPPVPPPNGWEPEE